MLGLLSAPQGPGPLAALAGPLYPELEDGVPLPRIFSPLLEAQSPRGGEGALEHMSLRTRTSEAGLDAWDRGCPARPLREGHSQGTGREQPALADLGQTSSKALSCLWNEVPMLISEEVRGVPQSSLAVAGVFQPEPSRRAR